MADARRVTAHPTLIALVIGGLVLAGGIALIVVLGRGGGSDHHTGNRDAGARVTGSVTAPPARTTSTPAPSTTAAPATSTPSRPTPTRAKPSTSKPPAHKPAKPVIYVVKPGDNLTVIARWFHQHGYIDLYERNRKVIGDNPNLILPGQRITITAGGRMTLAK